jgi:hypothetical protein
VQLSGKNRRTKLYEGPQHLNPHIKHNEMSHIKTNNFMNKKSHKVDECSDDDHVHCAGIKLISKQLLYYGVYYLF